MKREYLRYVIGFIIICAFAFLISCGSKDDDDDGEGTTSEIIISVELVDQETRQTTNTISIINPGEILIEVEDASGNPITDRLLTVATTKGTLNPVDGTAITDSQGLAELTLLAGDDTGAGEITVTIETFQSTPLAFQIGIVEVRLGAFIDGIFIEGELELSVASGELLSPGGTATVTATLVDSNDELFVAQPVEITFSSLCVDTGRSAIDEIVTTNNGSATAIYRANGCEGLDTITATANTGGNALVATATIDVAGSPVGSIQFVSALPKTIALQGTGGANREETSVVVFRVVDENGNPASNSVVNFSLSTEIGGLSLGTYSAQSDSDGYVQVVVISGNVPTPVRVNATVADTSISTVSDELVISTGLPDQNSFSISSTIDNPEAWNYDGERVEVTILAADHFNNPVPDGTAIWFTTEGGSIEPSCTTINGGCTVTWTSQDPRPFNGLVTLLATAIGEESFIDENANGLFDASDILQTDLPEAYRDDNWDGIFNQGVEEFIDFNFDSLYTPANSVYNGVLCSDLDICTNELVHVRDDKRIVMSGSVAYISFYDSTGRISQIDLANNTPGETKIFYVIVNDRNGNAMPYGTTIGATTTLGQLKGSSSLEVPSTLFPVRLDLVVKEGGDPSGVVTIEVITPKGTITRSSIPIFGDE
ncbi:MAG: hypothetical protein SWO11_04930 [Thermodesulfobacteriota bacterium]|nr:hypothetical protein [Thermodesulfobacteriota bacterium]